MSIHILIDECLARKDLFRLHPYDPSTKIARLMYVSHSIMNYLQSADIRAGYVHGDLDSFIGGDEILVSLVPHKARKAYMGLLKPPENGIWDIRCRDPKPGMRVMGGFAKKDSFIALSYFERKDKDTPSDWRIAIAECDRQWAALFKNNLPMIGVSPSDYLSNCACVD